MADFNERSDRFEPLDCESSSSPLPTGFFVFRISMMNFSSRTRASCGVICKFCKKIYHYIEKMQWEFSSHQMNRTFSSIAIWRIFHKKSMMPMMNAITSPTPTTMKTPPTLSIPSSGVSPPPSSLAHLPTPPFNSYHHFSLSSCNLPSSCNFKMACDICVRQGESALAYKWSFLSCISRYVEHKQNYKL